MKKEDNCYIPKKTVAKNYYKHKEKAERFYKAIKDGKKAMVINHHNIY